MSPEFEPAPEVFGATLARRSLHPIAHIDPVNCTEQRGIPGPWHERLPHFRMNFTPSVGEELQTEYIVPRRHAFAAFQAIHKLREQIAPLLQISEVRTIAADDLWMSPFYQQDSVALHFTWVNDWPSVKDLLPQLEESLAAAGSTSPLGQAIYDASSTVTGALSEAFGVSALLRSFDPDGKFRNAFLETYIFGRH